MIDVLTACALAPVVAVAKGMSWIISAVYAATCGDKFRNLLLDRGQGSESEVQE